MSTYVIGDIQGCYDELKNLLKLFNFNPQKDCLWFCGDLVNRGPKSLDVLRFVQDLKNKKIVLGNHDFHLLVVSENPHLLSNEDTFTDVLGASDQKALCVWLKQQALLHYDAESDYVLVHAGLAPQWDLAQAQACAAELETFLKTTAYDEAFLKNIYDNNEPRCWSGQLTDVERLRFSLNCFTRLRFCDEEGNVHLEYKGPLGSQPENLLPWYEISWRKNKNLKILFGHWSALQKTKVRSQSVFPLDTGCVWGGQLTALCLETRKYYQESCPVYAKY
ncbi:MAG: hypothetical protein ACD_44C00399G0003 [uncultured bacterium]|nr:MAG: hypothetical protein ACD_44C00399G0003 [uncultured bacterium]OGT17004.1 MAG: bis(5'-nucleosyl)-tetraphosphatase (symmetrical) [Gammaproteobacteria bacterium RIFCSPHIGHO2_02_FULL_38_33]OGT23868.1 MAG: bis(5'-nucleosyl)-tetraphosphatase (symmetrical) [Gammaproteobacteria bacterium RIFCSPHIGHO2_12_38_15]OGT69124.1 MAG: bis(5'-nucleosyl)-tetraphosphatase (symmetrical) [Gammaproteobacteria bacterium RIFCSPLOWO2_02_FULL_38_11]OGT77719.1 MAG: bis(5'-nucleosyl)-tetraphosphatase (symmetrical) [G